LDTARLKVDETLLALWSQAGTQTFTLSTLTVGDGVHKFTSEVLVKAGNRAESTILVIVDNTPPTAEIQQPRDGSFVSGLVLVELRAEDENFNYMELTVKVSRINGRRNIKYFHGTPAALSTVPTKFFDGC